MRIMDALICRLIPDDGVNDVGWLEQIDQLLDELDPTNDDVQVAQLTKGGRCRSPFHVYVAPWSAGRWKTFRAEPLSPRNLVISAVP
jgi:hypothetical protein